MSRNSLRSFGPAIALIAIYGFFVIFAPAGFSTLRNLETILRQTAIVGTAALGMTLVIIMAGIDLSVGSIIALSTVIIAVLLDGGSPAVLAAVFGVLGGAVCGLVNGLVITRLKVLPFIATLGTLLIVRGLAKGLAGEQKVDAPLTWINDLLARMGNGSLLGVPVGLVLVAVLAVGVWLLLKYTIFGRQVVAIGSNENTARLCGVPVEKFKLFVYTLSGAFAGVAGLLQFSRLTVGDPTVAIGLELDVIAAVVIGGGSLSGGQGSVVGSLIGALIMTVIRSGCSQMGISNWIQEIITGSIIILAVALDRSKRKE